MTPVSQHATGEVVHEQEVVEWAARNEKDVETCVLSLEPRFLAVVFSRHTSASYGTDLLTTGRSTFGSSVSCVLGLAKCPSRHPPLCCSFVQRALRLLGLT